MANTPHFSPVRLKASSEEAAISQALMMVGATRDDVEVEVLEKTDKGVTVRVSPRRSNTESGDQSSQTGSQSDEADVSTSAVEEESEDIIEAPDYDEEGAEIEESVSASAEATAEESDEGENAPPRVVAREADPAQVERAQNLAQEFLERMGLEAQVKVVPPPTSTVEEVESATPIVYLDIEGEDVGILIGKHGQTLQSFQYLLNLTLNNRVHETDGDEHEALRVIVDAGGYRLRRAQSLEQAAHNAASRAKRDRRSIRLDPMPAHERRLVHIALRSDSEISTGSEGREPHRYVVVSPANRGNGYSGGQGGHSGRSRGPRRQSPYGSGSGGFGGGMPRRGN